MVLQNRKYSESFRYGWNQNYVPVYNTESCILNLCRVVTVFSFFFNTSQCSWQETTEHSLIKVYVFGSLGCQAENALIMVLWEENLTQPRRCIILT